MNDAPRIMLMKGSPKRRNGWCVRARWYRAVRVCVSGLRGFVGRKRRVGKVLLKGDIVLRSLVFVSLYLVG